MHPPLEPFAVGHLARPDGSSLYWETSGAVDGVPVLYLHGGPGGGLGLGGYRRRAAPTRHLIVGLDQRGCGRSTPWAIDDLEQLDRLTTGTLIADIEALREHLGVERWLVHGVSWGSTLALAYALEHPDRVSALVLVAITTGSRREIDWITDGVGRVFPERWREFDALGRRLAPDAGERPVERYAGALRDPDPAVRESAAEGWDTWESTHISLDPHWQPGPYRAEARDRRNFATLVTHFWAHDCFLAGDRAVLERAAELGDLHGVLIHGRRDVSGPAETAWELARRWPGARLQVVEHEGHGGPDSMELASAAIDALTLHRP
ncbi:alpha/beta fold hydrolase [Schumannella soli]|uniref:Proline iminopeptidase n=1 Tax=Schumannella soli TaxID=2590779 RepID=A0A506XU52_9MICO|nr:alpha/beta fold hydrolase [Schumannella soli]TPW76364.1 alpha/beta fold hydrolase [Schumannella soli]